MFSRGISRGVLTVLIFAVFLIGCAGIGLKISDQADQVIKDGVISTVSYLIIKNNPKFRDPLIKWYEEFLALKDFDNLKSKFKDGIEKLSQSVSHDPYLTMQIQRAMGLIEISPEGPATELDLGKYQHVVDVFMEGVIAVPYRS